MTTAFFFPKIKDYITLTKPRITFFCLLMTAGGIGLSQGNKQVYLIIAALLGTALSVASANIFNMIYENQTDKLMQRTKFRPLPMAKISLLSAFIFALILGLLSLFIFAFFINILTAILALFAILSYSLIYTPLKYRTPLALVIGAVPGAIPPLLGFTSFDNKITLSAVVFFGILFAWQIPHFIAICIFHDKDYENAGIKVVSLIRGNKVAKIQAFLWSVFLFVMSLLLYPLNQAGIFYLITAFCLGIWYLALALKGIKSQNDYEWSRRFFYASLIYLPILILGLLFDRLFVYFF